MSNVRLVLVLLLLGLGTWPTSAKQGAETYTVGGMIEGMAPARGSFPGHLVGVPKTQVSLQPTGGLSQPASYATTTDYVGHYIIANIPPGTYLLTASRPGVGTATSQVVVGGRSTYVAQNLVLSNATASTGPTPAASLTGGPAVSSGVVFVAMAPQQAGSVRPSSTSSPSTAGRNSFGRHIPGPPAMNMGGITELMYNGGDTTLAGTGHKRGDPFEAFSEGHVVIPSARFPKSIMRMDANQPARVDYAPRRSTPYWLALNAQGSELFVADDQQGIDIYDVGKASLVGHIQAGGMVNDLVLSSDGNWIFAPVSAETPGVLVINTSTNQPVRFVPTPRLAGGVGIPTSVAVSRDSRRIYVSLSSARAGEVVCIDTVSRQVVSRCGVGAQPLGIALTPDARVLFCANNASASVSVIEAAGMHEIGRVHVGIAPCRIAVKPDGTKAYVTCKGSAEVAVIRSTATVAGTIPVGEGPTGIAISPDGTRVFVSNTSAATISIIDADQDVVQHTTSAQLLSRPYGIAIARPH